MNKYVRAASYFSYNFLNFTNQFFSSFRGCTSYMYHKFDYKSHKSTLIVYLKKTNRINKIGK